MCYNKYNYRGAGSLPGYTKDLPTFRQWMADRNWANAWSVYDNISAISKDSYRKFLRTNWKNKRLKSKLWVSNKY
ncbi:MAG TPA: hypothetical protein DDW50_20255 [Firmicutes bacterium]|nr:hypothetical protein [Bacillota bacterium]